MARVDPSRELRPRLEIRDAEHLRSAVELMSAFATRTGLAAERAPRRYLWTDAFAVCTFLELAEATGDSGWAELAVDLVAQVHRVLGRHCPELDRGERDRSLSPDPEAHPTAGGLRIGKPLPERTAEEPYVPALEWERDGQYFHYLTKWVHALDRMARWSREVRYHRWARELLVVAHRAFAYGPRGARRMRWKMSIDLGRPLVATMGQHDPLDGFVTCAVLEATADALGAARAPSLEAAAEDFASMLEPSHLATRDPLGIGSLLFDAARLLQAAPRSPWIDTLLADAAAGTDGFLDDDELRMPAESRLAFRELGLAIGLEAVPLFVRAGRELYGLDAHRVLADEITAFWLDPDHRRTRTWTAHADIDDVMLATALAPAGFLRA